MRVTHVMACHHVLFSHCFSMPVCRYPMTGVTSRTISPSSSTMTRSTPCVDGWLGPRLMMSGSRVPGRVSASISLASVRSAASCGV